jgi:protein-L-isoaspartate(D-aspartate) O-methyltransferase
LSHLVEAVSTIEILATLGERAKNILGELGFKNIAFKVGDGFYGWQERAPFDAILMTAAAPKIPEALVRQLRDGGRLVMPLGEAGKSQRLIRARKIAGRLKIEDFSEVLFVPLRGAIEQPAR